MILSLIFILIGFFEVFEFDNSKLNARIRAVGFLLQMVYYSKMFWYKNYIQWNKKGAVIRINSFLLKSMSFEQIQKTELTQNELIITKYNGKAVIFNLKAIAENDIHELNEIILSNITIDTNREDL
jgi:hypothetical protein